MRAAFLALTGAVMLGGCASDKLTLVQNEDDNPTGAVAILDPITGEDQALVDAPLTEAKLTKRPKKRTVKQIKPAYTALLESLPKNARRFTISFGNGETRIPVAQIGIIGLIEQELRERPPGAQIEVVGFTDRVDDANKNLGISEKRARDVIAELNERGFTVDPNDAVGRGELAAEESGDLDNVENELWRKVEVIVR